VEGQPATPGRVVLSALDSKTFAIAQVNDVAAEPASDVGDGQDRDPRQAGRTRRCGAFDRSADYGAFQDAASNKAMGYVEIKSGRMGG